MIKKAQSLSILASISLHILLGVLLFANFDTTLKSKPIASFTPELTEKVEPKPKPIIDAVAITESDLQQEVARLEKIEKEKHEAEAKKQRDLEQKRAALERKRKQEQARLANLKKERERIQKEEQQREKARLAKLEKEKEDLAKIKQEKETLIKEKKRIEEEKKAAELAKQQQEEAEKARLAKEKAQKEALEREQLAKIQAEKELAARLQREKEEAEKQRQKALETQRIIAQQVNTYVDIIRNKVNQNWRRPIGLDSQAYKSVLAVKVAPNGEVLEARVVQSSGNLEFDRSSELAIKKSSPLPLPEHTQARKEFFDFNFIFEPEA